MLERIRYRDFCTKDACYTFNYAFHFETTNPPSLEKYDAIVIEISDEYDFPSREDIVDFYLFLRENRQYRRIIEENEKLKQPKPIYFVDIPPHSYFKALASEYISVSIPYFVLSSYDGVVGSIYLMLYLSSIFASKYTGKILSTFSLLNPHATSTFRNAVVAKKIDEFIAQELRNRYEKEKPNIFLEYGAGHVGIETMLKHKKLRKYIIESNACCNPIIRATHEVSQYLNKIGEIRYKNSPEISHFAEKFVKKRETFRRIEYILYEVPTI